MSERFLESLEPILSTVNSMFAPRQEHLSEYDMYLAMKKRELSTLTLKQLSDKNMSTLELAVSLDISFQDASTIVVHLSQEGLIDDADKESFVFTKQDPIAIEQIKQDLPMFTISEFGKYSLNSPRPFPHREYNLR